MPKFMNMRNRYFSTLSLQLFAEGDGDGAGDDAGDGDDQDDDQDDPDADEGGEDEPKYTQADLDKAVDKAVSRTIAKERRKAERAAKKQQKSGGSSEDDGSENDKKLKDAENRALKAETRAACFEAGVDKDAIEDVTALAHSYMEADDSLDLEDAIEKVVKKYPHFKKSAAKADDDVEDETKRKSWGERQKGAGGKKLTGVEEAFLKKNPGLKY